LTAVNILDTLGRVPTAPTVEASVSARKVREWTVRRDDAIWRAVADGVPLRQLAAATQLSHEAIRLIARRAGRHDDARTV
jgi:hypothetical protein